MGFSYRVEANGAVRDLRTDSEHQLQAHIFFDQQRVSWLQPFRPVAKDLMQVALAVHHVDRLSSRRRGGPEAEPDQDFRWVRDIGLEISVSSPERWEAQRGELERFLGWMTDDHWSLRFLQAEHEPWQQPDLFPERLPDGAEVALFSGGLDSVAGAYAKQLTDGRPLYLVSSIGNAVRERSMRQALDAVTHAGRGVCRWVRLRHQLLATNRADETQRARGFLFLTAAAVVADALDINTVSAFEAGVGAMNLPLNASQVGAQNTRAMHPRTVIGLERVLRSMLERPIRLELPYLLHTKGELCRLCSGSLERLACVANSCDETERGKSDGMEHCGICTSCVLRRAALHVAIPDGDPTNYRMDATRRSGQYELTAFEEQAKRLGAAATYRDLLLEAPELRFAEHYLARPGRNSVDRLDAQSKLMSLFQRHATEVASLFADLGLRCNPRATPSTKRKEKTNDALFRANR